MKLFLRLYAECKDIEQSEAQSKALLSALSHLSPLEASIPSAYWKVPKLFEFTYILSPPTESSFQSLISMALNGWSHSGQYPESSSVWNREAGSVFLAPEVTWAEIQIYESTP